MKFGGQPTPWSDEQIDGLRCRTVAQMLIEEIGADGPESAEDAAKRAVAVIQRQRARIAAMASEHAAMLASLREAEAALADIGDADREPGDDVAWCEARAAKALPAVRDALAKAGA